MANNTPLLVIVMNEADCCSTKHNACSDYGRVEGCASVSDAGRPRVALEDGVRAKLQRGRIVLEFRRTGGVEASTPSVSRRRIRRGRPAPALPVRRTVFFAQTLSLIIRR
jgi:hypothetical protein